MPLTTPIHHPATPRSKKAKKKDKDEDDVAKMRSGLEGAIVKETPNVRWSDIAGAGGYWVRPQRRVGWCGRRDLSRGKHPPPTI